MINTCTVIAPYGTVGDTRDAAGDLFGGGRDLDGGGQAWDCPLTEEQADRLREAGAEVHQRSSAEGLRDVVEANGYTLAPVEEL